MARDIIPHDEHGPRYPMIAAANKFRKLAAKGPLSAEDTKAYGAAVLEGIRKLQRTELARVFPAHRCPCASGTWHSEGADIMNAVRKQHEAELQAAANAARSARTDAQLIAQYKAAMAEKRAREAEGSKPEPVIVAAPAPEPVTKSTARKPRAAKAQTMRAAARSARAATAVIASKRYYVAGQFDLAAIMGAAIEAARLRLARCGGTWQGAMSIALRSTWRAAKAERAAESSN